MVEAILRTTLGPLSPVLDFMKTNPIAVSAILLVWFCIYYAGRIQLKRIEAKTAELVLEMSKKLIARNKSISAASLYEQINPKWEDALKGWGCYFIPHRFDLWPVPVRPEAVRQKLAFSPLWIAAVLRANHIPLKESGKLSR